MKLFSTIEELWQYILYCPLCQESCRNISVDIGPSDLFKSEIHFEKNQQFLTIKAHLSKVCAASYRKKILFNINCLSNNFEFISLQSEIKPIKTENLYFYLQGHCYQCYCAATYSFDIYFDFSNYKLKSPFALERESITVEDNENRHYHLIQDYIEKKTRIYLSHSNVFRSNLLDIDISNKDILLKKIKTIIIFG